MPGATANVRRQISNFAWSLRLVLAVTAGFSLSVMKLTPEAFSSDLEVMHVVGHLLGLQQSAVHSFILSLKTNILQGCDHRDSKAVLNIK